MTATQAAASIIDAIDHALGCHRCGGPLGASPDDLFCSEPCQEAWHQSQLIPPHDFFRCGWTDGEVHPTTPPSMQVEYGGTLIPISPNTSSSTRTDALARTNGGMSLFRGVTPLTLCPPEHLPGAVIQIKPGAAAITAAAIKNL